MENGRGVLIILNNHVVKMGVGTTRRLAIHKDHQGHRTCYLLPGRSTTPGSMGYTGWKKRIPGKEAGSLIKLGGGIESFTRLS